MCAHSLLTLPEFQYTEFVKKFPKLLVAGVFDHFHVGHQYFLHQAISVCDELVVIIGRTSTVEHTKGRKPIHSETQRLKRIEAEKIPHAHVRLGREDGDVWETIREENPDAILLGYDQRFDEKKCRDLFPNIQILRAKEYRPEQFKSSKFK